MANHHEFGLFMQTFLKLGNIRINVVFITHYTVKTEENHYQITIHLKDGGFRDHIELEYRGELANKKFNEDLKKLDETLLMHH